MFTLLERLKDEVRQKMEEEREEYEAMMGHIERALSKHEFVFDLPYGTVMYMQMYLGIDSPYDAFEDKD